MTDRKYNQRVTRRRRAWSRLQQQHRSRTRARQRCIHDYTVRDSEGFAFYVTNLCVRCGEPAPECLSRKDQLLEQMYAAMDELDAEALAAWKQAAERGEPGAQAIYEYRKFMAIEVIK